MPRADGSFLPEELSLLRERKVIESTEVVFQYGDLFVAENVITRTRRQLSAFDITSVMSEGRKVLNG